MATTSYKKLIDFTLFGRTFVPGGSVFPTPHYTFDTSTAGEVTYTRTQPYASTGYYNIHPRVTLKGADLTVNANGQASGTITSITFGSSNRGKIAEISDISLSADDFTQILDARLSGDRYSNDHFEKFLATPIQTMSFSRSDDTINDSGFLIYLDKISLRAGDDEFILTRPRGNDRLLDGGRGTDTLSLFDFGAPENFIVDLKTGTITTDDTSVSFTNFEIIDGNAFVDRYIGSHRGDTINAAGRDDLIHGNKGNDSLSGGWGNDVIRGNSGRDSLLGEQGDDRLIGGNGADTIDGGLGQDTLTGGSGADTFVFSAAPGTERIRDFSVSDGDQLRFVSNDDFRFHEDFLFIGKNGIRLRVENTETEETERLVIKLTGGVAETLTPDLLADHIDFA
jgi:Ca2+-binding RTX toxin-like protein